MCSAKSCSGATSRTKLGKGNTNCQQRPSEITESSEELSRVCISTNSKLTRAVKLRKNLWWPRAAGITWQECSPRAGFSDCKGSGDRYSSQGQHRPQDKLNPTEFSALLWQLTALTISVTRQHRHGHSAFAELLPTSARSQLSSTWDCRNNQQEGREATETKPCFSQDCDF